MSGGRVKVLWGCSPVPPSATLRRRAALPGGPTGRPRRRAGRSPHVGGRRGEEAGRLLRRPRSLPPLPSRGRRATPRRHQDGVGVDAGLRAPARVAHAPARVPEAAPRVLGGEAVTMPRELPNIAGIFGPILQRLPAAERPLLIAVAERLAAERYRGWAAAASDPAWRAALLACAAREEDIARRVEALYPDAAATQARILR